jgi:hypothetical protein
MQLFVSYFCISGKILSVEESVGHAGGFTLKKFFTLGSAKALH